MVRSSKKQAAVVISGTRQELRERFESKPVVKLDHRDRPIKGPAFEVARCGLRKRARPGEDFRAFGAFVRKAGSRSPGVWWPLDRIREVRPA